MNLHRLTPAERGVLEAYAAGCQTIAEVSLVLKLSGYTVRNHKRSIYGKLGLKSSYDFGRYIERHLSSGGCPCLSVESDPHVGI
jgi:DNA-binding CsgD family transcriptional regulator